MTICCHYIILYFSARPPDLLVECFGLTHDRVSRRHENFFLGKVGHTNSGAL